MGERYRSALGRGLRRSDIVVALVLGSGLMLIASAIGHAAVGPGPVQPGGDPPPLADDDTFRFAAIGAAIASGVPVLLAGARDRPRWGAALAVAVVVGVLIGLAARGSAAG